MPKKWRNVQSVVLKLPDSASLPVFAGELDQPKRKAATDEAPKKKKAHEPAMLNKINEAIKKDGGKVPHDGEEEKKKSWLLDASQLITKTAQEPRSPGSQETRSRRVQEYS